MRKTCITGLGIITADASGVAAFSNPGYALAFMDTDLCGLVSVPTAGRNGLFLFKDELHKVCRPMDSAWDGFIFGESCAALVVKSVDVRRSGAIRSIRTGT